MNFLAHLYLSPDNDEVRVGNFMADSVKGTQWEKYSPNMQKGIFLHRTIDSFTDTHENVIECIHLLRPYFRLYAGAVVDIYFDHFLAANWHIYSNRSLADYASAQYAILSKYSHNMPATTKILLHYLKQDNWLENYKDSSFLERVFNGMAKRTAFTSHMEMAPQQLIENYDFFKQAFFAFFPHLQQKAIQFCNEWENKHLNEESGT